MSDQKRPPIHLRLLPPVVELDIDGFYLISADPYEEGALQVVTADPVHRWRVTSNPDGTFNVEPMP